MTSDLTLLQETQGVQPITIGLPNGTYALANKQGLVSLGQKIKLDYVLFVPSFKCNLVSIARLCTELNCMVTFFDDFCELQDHTLKFPIGVGEQQGGTYYFKDRSWEVNQVASSKMGHAVNSSNLWHRRLGHPSKEILSLLPSTLGVVFDKDKNKVC